MSMRNIIILVFVTVVSNINAQQSELSKFEFNGYIKDVQTAFIPNSMSCNWLSDNAFHNRLVLKYYPTSWLTFDSELRNRFIFGDFVKLTPNYSKFAFYNQSYLNLNKAWATDSSYVGLSELDRLNLQFTFDDWEITIGRQRINWGMNLVWNPNDIFNTFSYFDFEYEERPGTDAVRIKYYSGLTSSVEVVYKAGDSISAMAAAALYRFNYNKFDFQVLSGFMGDDYVVGAGLTGSIKDAAIRAELSYFKPRNGSTKDVTVVSISGDYTFESSLYIHSGILVNTNGKKTKPGEISLFNTQELSPKNLSRGFMNVFCQASYNVTPLITANVSAIINPYDKSSFVSPSVSASVSDNFAVSLFGQMFMGQNNTEFGKIGQMFYVRFKYDF